MFRHLEEVHVKASELEFTRSLTLVHVHPRMGIPNSFSGLKKGMGRGTQENQEIQKGVTQVDARGRSSSFKEIVLGEEHLSGLQQGRNQPAWEGY